MNKQKILTTRHWHIGHILTATEQCMFDFSHQTTHLPANYIELFDKGTKPAGWKGNIPTIDELITQLKEPLVRLQQIPTKRIFNRS